MKAANKLIKASDVDDTAEDQGNYKIQEGGVDAFGRKVWKVVKEGEEGGEQEGEQPQQNVQDSDDEGYEEEDEDQGPVFLQKRNVDLGLDRVVGKRMQVSSDVNVRNTGVYKCDLCDCVCKDSLSWLDHLNGKKHNQMLGMSMKVEKVSLDSVKDKFKSLRKKETRTVENFEDFEMKYQEEQRMRKERKNKKKNKQMQKINEQNAKNELDQNYSNKNDEKQQEQEEEDPEMAMMKQLGLPCEFK